MTTHYPKLILDIMVSVFLVLVAGYLLWRQPSDSLPKEALGMLLMFYLGLLFACAYAVRERLLLFKALSLVSEYLSYPQRRQMALVYAAVFFAISAFYSVKLLNAG